MDWTQNYIKQKECVKSSLTAISEDLDNKYQRKEMYISEKHLRISYPAGWNWLEAKGP
jgi:hypothetical protein